MPVAADTRQQVLQADPPQGRRHLLRSRWLAAAVCELVPQGSAWRRDCPLRQEHYLRRIDTKQMLAPDIFREQAALGPGDLVRIRLLQS